MLTTHLSFAPPRAVRQLREVVAWARPLPRPLVLVGDLNLPGRLPALLTGWTPAATGPTHPARRPRRRLDHVLLDAGPGDARVAGAGVRGVGESDHLAVVAEVVGLRGD
ncbi:endonuclease/exonuclease/phosphatase family protein [Nocardioides marinquilinus]|uniref:endonuclease/exonuclease/phosphatase family protein n=1 Tax=Nocardioides marinquilinus TaxID=1210400 RepID=UPI0031E65A9C